MLSRADGQLGEEGVYAYQFQNTGFGVSPTSATPSSWDGLGPVLQFSQLEDDANGPDSLGCCEDS